MKEIMNWKICEREHIKKISIDKDKISSILKMCDARFRFVEKQDIDDETASIITEDYYEIIKELLIALLLKNGLKSDNHECLISYFKEKHPEYEYELNIIYELKNIRNRISYDGIFVKKEYLVKNTLELKNIIKVLKELVEEDE